MSKKNRRVRLVYVVAISLAVVAVVLFLLDITNVIHLYNKHAPATGSSYTKGEPQTSSKPSATNNSNTTNPSTSHGTQQTDKGNSSAGSVAAVGLLSPTGDFVSNHHPNLSGSSASNSVTSVCNTTPAASCTISFTQNGITKSLSAETVDSGGSAYWNWTLKDVGLTTGSWSIQAAASLGGQTKTATDAMMLTISP